MGVPAFFKWLTIRCPTILLDVLKNYNFKDPDMNADDTPEIDNFYLDMNGIIHPCTHPENIPIPKPLTEADMFNNIFEYVDRLVSIVKPKKLIYFAIDGVAPRAKMNQQRSRRFRAAQEAKATYEKKEALKNDWRDKGLDIPDDLDVKYDNKFDSNVITPGTEFMQRLSVALQYFITERINHHPRYKNLMAVYSDATIPGEGEHKILHFIRQQRLAENYDPNKKHCIYGADADLIMLGLSTHEPHFYIIRETVMTQTEKKKLAQRENAFILGDQKEGEFHEKEAAEIPIIFQFIKLFVVREFLDFEFRNFELPFPYSLERIVDDFVFMCFFVGNDFVPHLPMLQIREGGIDAILYLYKRVLPSMRGYLTENGQLDLEKVDVLLAEVAKIEDVLLKDITKSNDYMKNRNAQKSNPNVPGGPGGREQNRGSREETKQAPPVEEYSEDNYKKIGAKESDERNRQVAIELRRALAALGGDATKKIEEEKTTAAEKKSGAENNPVSDKIEGSQSDKGQKNAEVTVPTETQNQNSENEKARAGNQNENMDDENAQDERNRMNESLEEDQIDQLEETKIEFEIEKVIIEEEELKEGEENLVVPPISETARFSVEEPNEQAQEEEPQDPTSLFNKQLKDLLKASEVDPQKQEDTIRLGERGYRERYYYEKFHILPQELPEFTFLIKKAYVEALCWIFSYYYKGCISWNWFYPFHYAPLAVDLQGINQIQIKFDMGKPFRPFDQLLAVFPPYSSRAIPPCFWPLMTSPESEIADFYPIDFLVDIKGKRFAWMGEVLLPFIEEERLLKAVEKHENGLTPDEIERNRLGKELIFISKSHDIFHDFKSKTQQDSDLESEQMMAEVSQESSGVTGKIFGYPQKFKIGFKYTNYLSCNALEEIPNNQVLALAFENPTQKPHLCELLEGVREPPKELQLEILANDDRKGYSGSRVLKIIERSLEIYDKYSGEKGTLNQTPYEMQTLYGHNVHHAHNTFSRSYNNNRGVYQFPTQFKNPNIQPNPERDSRHQSRDDRNYQPDNRNQGHHYRNSPPRRDEQGPPRYPPRDDQDPNNRSRYDPHHRKAYHSDRRYGDSQADSRRDGHRSDNRRDDDRSDHRRDEYRSDNRRGDYQRDDRRNEGPRRDDRNELRYDTGQKSDYRRSDSHHQQDEQPPHYDQRRQPYQSQRSSDYYQNRNQGGSDSRAEAGQSYSDNRGSRGPPLNQRHNPFDVLDPTRDTGPNQNSRDDNSRNRPRPPPQHQSSEQPQRQSTASFFHNAMASNFQQNATILPSRPTFQVFLENPGLGAGAGLLNQPRQRPPEYDAENEEYGSRKIKKVHK